LGRGLEALLGRVVDRSEPPTETDRPSITPRSVESVGTIPIRREDDRPYVEYGTGRYDSSADEPPAIDVPAIDPPAVDETPSAATPPGPGIPHAGGDPAVVQVDVHLIDSNPFQPRRDFDEEGLDSLTESLTDHGLLQPLVVRRVDESYQLIAGERRFRAAKKAGWREVPVKVIEADDRRMTELAIVENLQRKDLNALEKAASFQQYLQMHGSTQEELAKRLKIDRSTIANLIRLLELPEPVQTAVRSGKITQGHARALLPLGDEGEQNAFSERIQREGLSVRETERQVQEMIAKADAEPLAVIGRDGKPRRAKQQNAQLAALEQEFRAALGTKVKLTHSANGRGRLVVHFNGHEEFERLRRHLLGTESSSKVG
jgi:ParB family chromosome partitioning protein